MPLDGLRAWIAEVEHKLGMRTRVFLALAAIAIGGAGAGIYLAADARDGAVSEEDVQILQSELEAKIESASTGGGESARLEGEVKALQAQVEALQGESGGPAGKPEEDGGTSPKATPDGEAKSGEGELLPQPSEKPR